MAPETMHRSVSDDFDQVGDSCRAGESDPDQPGSMRKCSKQRRSMAKVAEDQKNNIKTHLLIISYYFLFKTLLSKECKKIIEDTCANLWQRFR